MNEHQWEAKVAAIHSLRCNVKSLAAEAKFIQKEEKRCGKCYRDGLRYHRVSRLREEARYACLALAFTRGRPYLTVEQKAEHLPEVKRLYEKIKRHLGNVFSKDVENWLSTPLVIQLVLQSVAAEQQGAALGFQSKV